MIKLAKISSINKQTVELDFQNSSECSDCKSNCSSGFLNFLFHRNANKMVVAFKKSGLDNSHVVDQDSFFGEQHQVNDIVGLKFNENQLLKFSLLLYGLPIVLLIVSLILGSTVFNQLSLNQDLGGFLGLVSGLFLARSIVKFFKIKSIPKVIFFK